MQEILSHHLSAVRWYESSPTSPPAVVGRVGPDGKVTGEPAPQGVRVGELSQPIKGCSTCLDWAALWSWFWRCVFK